MNFECVALAEAAIAVYLGKDRLFDLFAKHESPCRIEFKEDGSPGRTRTADLVVNSHLLYQLSYRGTREE